MAGPSLSYLSEWGSEDREARSGSGWGLLALVLAP